MIPARDIRSKAVIEHILAVGLILLCLEECCLDRSFNRVEAAHAELIIGITGDNRNRSTLACNEAAHSVFFVYFAVDEREHSRMCLRKFGIFCPDGQRVDITGFL